jgi:hypothetical protein
MGWFEDSPKDTKLKQLKEKIKQKGLLNLIDEKDYQKASIIQRDAMISLLAQIVISNSGMLGDAMAIKIQDDYYNSLKDIMIE